MSLGRYMITAICAFITAFLLTGCDLYRVDNRISEQDYVIRMTAERNTAEEEIVENDLSDLSEKDLISIFKDKSGIEIKGRYYDDYDHDGKRELFVTTGDILASSGGGDQAFYGKLWLVNSLGVTLVSDDYGGMSVDSEIWRFDDRDYFVSRKTYDTGNRTYLWSVTNGVAIKNSISGLGDVSYSDGDIKVVSSSLDTVIEDGEASGLVSKSYDMGYSGGNFFEYGGISMPQSEFLKYDGADEILAMLSEDYPEAYYSMLYHSNGIIYINITHKLEGKTYHNSCVVNIEGDSVSMDRVEKGHFESAILKEIAVYPSRFSMN